MKSVVMQSANQHNIKTSAPCKSTARRSVKAAVQLPGAVEKAVAKSAGGPIILDGTVLHSAKPQQLELMSSMQPFFAEKILPLLTPVDELWQPADFLPLSHTEEYMDQVKELREKAKELPDELFVCLIGDMITEEALPTYMAMLNTLDGVRDETGRDQTPYAKWTREWIAEENRHGDLLNRYLYLSGRVDMKSVEKTVQRLISTGMDPKTENHPYLCYVFTSFQERATKISHGGTARIAKQYGDNDLAVMCGRIAQDESRHEAAYTRTMDAIFKADPNGAMLAFADMMRKKIVMPAHLMDDGEHRNKNDGRGLFDDFADVAESIGVYTAQDYISIMEHLIDRWQINKLTGLNEEATEALDYVSNLPQRIRRLAERKQLRKSKGPSTSVQFSWIFDRPIAV